MIRDPSSCGEYLAAVHARWIAERSDQRACTLSGTLLFADVSGFTALSERLARLGPIGAEELTELLNAVFDGMLTEVTAFGGDVLKFGGDAILVLFDGRGHEVRACAAAAGIQAGMRRFRNFETSGGRVSLRVSEGVATGDIDLFLVGEGHSELVVGGAVARAVLAMERLASGGQVVISRSTAAAIEPRLVGASVGRGRLLAGRPSPTPGVPPQRPPDIDVALALPAHLRGRELTEGEHRVVSVAFVGYAGTGRIARARGREALIDQLNRLVSVCQDACVSHEATFLSTDLDDDGGKIIVITGAPDADPDAGERVLHVARSIVAQPSLLDVRVGVNRGRVFVHDIGAPGRRSWTVMGDAVNLAARVMGKAPAGHVLATAKALDSAREAFATTPVEPFRVKGMSQPVHAQIVGDALDRRSRSGASGKLTIAGREAELRLIRELVEGALQGSGRAVEIVGEAGLGKTRLLRAVVAGFPGVRRIDVEAGPYGRFSPYLALRRPLRELLGVPHDARDEVVETALRAAIDRDRPDLAPWLPLIAPPFGVEIPDTAATADLGAEFRRGRLLDMATAFVDALLGQDPCIVVVEDTHWIDDASAGLLHRIAAGVGARPRAVLLTGRPGPGAMTLLEGVAERITLGALDHRALHQIVTEAEEAVSSVLPPHVERLLLLRAAGNPLLLKELVAAALGGAAPDDLPDSVEALVTARIDSLPPADRQFLRQVSVFGFHVQVPVLVDVLGLEEGAVTAAIGRLGAFLEYTAPDRLSFSHALVRDAAYGALPFRRRRELHARAADVLLAAGGSNAAEEASLLALHEHAAGMWARTWEHARAAGRRALARAAPVEAAQFLSMALDAVRHLPPPPACEVAAVADALAEAHQRVGALGPAKEAYRLARRAVGDDPLASAEFCRKEGRLLERSRNYSLALRWYTRAHKLIEPLPPSTEVTSLRAKLLCAQTATRLRQGRMREALPLVDEAIDAALASGDRAALAHAY